MIREYIERYLTSGNKTADRQVLEEMADRFISVTFRQFMEERGDPEPGKYYPSAATKCARQNGLRYAGMKGETLDSEVIQKFWYGDLAELGFLGLAGLALKDTPHSIGLNNEHLPVTLGKTHRETRNGYIDGLLSFDHEYHWETYKKGLRPRWLDAGKKEDILVEIKSMGAWAFNMFQKEGPNDTWGYLGQINSYLRELNVKRYLYVAIDKENGRIDEYLGDYSPRIAAWADETNDLVMATAQKGDVPPVPQGNPHIGLKANGELQLVCSYCGYKEACWTLQNYKLETRYVKARTGQKPIFYVVKDGDGKGQTVREAAQEKIDELAPKDPSEYSR